MKRALLLAEKPSVTRDIEAVYIKNRNKIDYEIDFDAFAGHVCELSEPDEYKEEWGKPWSVDVLPMIPSEWKKKISNNKIYERIINRIRTGNYDYIINACDAGREGELIFYNAIETMGINIPVLRYWASDSAPDTVAKALQNLRDASDYENLKNAAKCRAYFDWLIGMNFTRAACLKTNIKIIIGRVMTLVLAMIVRREQEIASFKPEPFYEIIAQFKNKDDKLYKGQYFYIDKETNKPVTRFTSKEQAEKIIASVNDGKSAVVKEKKSTKVKSAAPSLYNISDLERDAAKLFGYTPDKTLQLAQSLYEKKFLSYPRTESRHLSDNLSESVRERLKSVKPVEELTEYIDSILSDNSERINSVMKNKSYVDNTKLTDHHAIIPTEVPVDVSSLSQGEINIYKLVSKRFIAIFMDNFEYENLQMITVVDDIHFFRTSGKSIIKQGWKVLDDFAAKNKDVPLPPVSEGEDVYVDQTSLSEGKTTPPAHYNYDTIIMAMQNCGRTLEEKELKTVLKDKGVGTGATRAEIIKKLEEYQYIELSGSSKLKNIVPTKYGVKIYELLKDSSITSVTLTASWENKLMEMENGQYGYSKFYDEMIDFITQNTEDLLNSLKEVSGMDLMNVIGKCPVCSGDVIEGKKRYFCVNVINKKKKEEAEENGENFEGTICDFSFGKVIKSAQITRKDAVKLLTEGKTPDKTFTSSNGNKLKTHLEMKDGKICFPKFEVNTVGKCPACGEDVIEGKKSYFCRNVTVNVEGSDKKKCYFSIGKNIKGASISKETVSKLLKDKESEPLLFTWSSGKQSKSKLLLVQGKNENNEEIFKIAFPSFKSDIAVCPVCGSNFKETSQYYMCTKYKNGCNMIISKDINGADISYEDVKTLLAGKEIHKNFKWRKGTISDAYARIEIIDGMAKVKYRFPN